MFKIRTLARGAQLPTKAVNTAFLVIDNWDDFGFCTNFYTYVFDESGEKHEVGHTKIGFIGQTETTSTHVTLEDEFQHLQSNYFSLGQDLTYYQNVYKLPNKTRQDLLTALQDVVHVKEQLEKAIPEKVFKTSHLRYVSMSLIKGQFNRVLSGGIPLTDYSFSFKREGGGLFSPLQIRFKVKANSSPPTNIHAIIGRNGVGKTTILNNMISLITGSEVPYTTIVEHKDFVLHEDVINPDYFSRLVSVSFSAFDPFTPPQDQQDPALGTCYSYIGLKSETGAHQDIKDLQKSCVNALYECFQNKNKRERWKRAINTLESDESFDMMDLSFLEKAYEALSLSGQQNKKISYQERVTPYLNRMSSGHAIVLLTLSELVSKTEEKTLVLLDEPDSHLHPPLLAAFIRALSDLLYDRNGVAIIATHSPVIAQEIPRTCVNIIERTGTVSSSRKPKIETFGENVGLITREVFGLQVQDSGFLATIKKSIDSDKNYQEILEEYDGQLGEEGKVILKSLLINRKRDTTE